jgi:heme exporter protein D
MNLLSALATATAGGVTAWLFARPRGQGDADATTDARAWGAVAAALAAGLMASAWSNATETEVYAIALLHAVLLLACADRAGEEEGRAGTRWTALTAYLILLAPAVHLSVLVTAPAAIMLAARDDAGRWRVARAVALIGVVVVAAGVGRGAWPLVAIGALLVIGSALGQAKRSGMARVATFVALAVVASSAVLIMLVRARHDPALNQGDPSTLPALADVVARRQYDVAGLWPRRAPVWLQLANVMQYVDWQAALGWGRGVFTTPARVAATVVFVLLGGVGARALRRRSRRLGDATLMLLLCGTLGVAVYLNLRAGASLGWGILPVSAPHEARERDYFFVYGFWAWGCLAGCGALAFVRAKRWPAWSAVGVALLPLVGNWSVMNRREPERDAARRVAHAILESAPRNAVLFLAGDNDSYPLWYAQEVEGLRRDVFPVTMPLLSAEWYDDQVARRTRLRWPVHEPVPGTEWRHEQQAALIARAARAAGRPVAASPLLTPAERSLLGSAWVLSGVDYRSDAPVGADTGAATVDRAATLPWILSSTLPPHGGNSVDLAPETMLGLLECPRLARRETMPEAQRDSLEVRCNFR